MKMKTNNFFGEKYELEDISGVFSKGIRYSIKSSIKIIVKVL